MSQPIQHNEFQQPSGSLFVVSAPSGAGKSSLVRSLLEEMPELTKSVSHTTRPARPGEVHEKDYYFVSKKEFETHKAKGDFLEWAYVHNNHYGTSRPFVEAKMNAGQDIVLEIDWQGAQQISSRVRNTVSIFILPPSMVELESRLRGRGTDSEDVIEGRLQAARSEIAQAREFDFIIINDCFKTAILELKSVVEASRCRYNLAQAKHPALFKTLGLI